jgi:hypothetical protein
LLGSSEGQISIGILGFAMQACKTVAEALETALHYHPISGSVLDLTVNLLMIIVKLNFLSEVTVVS